MIISLHLKGCRHYHDINDFILFVLLRLVTHLLHVSRFSRRNETKIVPQNLIACCLSFSERLLLMIKLQPECLFW